MPGTLVLAVILLGTFRSVAAPSTLPVYSVVSSGASASQAGTLASYLSILSAMVSYSNGLVFVLDSANYLAVPTVPITDSTLASNLLAATKNPFPAIIIGTKDWSARPSRQCKPKGGGSSRATGRSRFFRSPQSNVQGAGKGAEGSGNWDLTTET
jgi:hypothetical protein